MMAKQSYANAQWGLQSTADLPPRHHWRPLGSFLIEVHDYAAFGEASSASFCAS